jgi:hypothetical protein
LKKNLVYGDFNFIFELRGKKEKKKNRKKGKGIRKQGGWENGWYIVIY